MEFTPPSLMQRGRASHHADGPLSCRLEKTRHHEVHSTLAFHTGSLVTTPALTSHLMAVFDRLDHQADSYDFKNFEAPLVAAAQEANQAQNMGFSGLAISKAAHQHVVALQTQSGQGTSPDPFNWGWKRPQNEAEIQQRLGTQSFWRKVIRKRARTHALNCITNGFLAILMTGLLLAVIRAPLYSFFLMLPSYLIGLLFTDKWLNGWITNKEYGLEESMPTKGPWEDIPACRRYVRACLLSSLPLFLQGDIDRLGALACEHETERKAIEASENRKNELASLHQRFVLDADENGNP